ncbi:putative cytochrome P450 120 [Liolophura sinensis]|uniref:putative cytochrome P450 120 n=1 Tax=Liolophura sinensis TaxID=3198878 RepID=UPI003158C525
MSAVPGKVGWPIVGDQSYSFYRDPTSFIEQNFSNHQSRIFKARFLNKPTVFVGSNKGVQDVLNDDSSALEMGYRAFMYQIYGDNILFMNDEESIEVRKCLCKLFTTHSIEDYQKTIDAITSKYLNDIDTSKPLCVYSVLKQLATEICLSLFLDLDFAHSKDLAVQISSLTKTHWHGIVSVPLNLKLPMGNSSTFGKALEAKASLLKVIEEKLQQKSGFTHKMEGLSFPNSSYIQNHLLLFTSALVPKAIASLLTSFITATGQHDQVFCQDDLLFDNALMESVLLEVERLYPPFIGGRRVARKDCVIGGYHIEEGQALVYLSHSAHRDPDVFKDPEKFDPGRWTNGNAKDKEKLFCFGAGPRACIGKNFVNIIVHTILKQFLQQFRWKLVDNQDLSPKWLPVSRPREAVMVQISREQESML